MSGYNLFQNKQYTQNKDKVKIMEKNNEAVADLLAKAKSDLRADMEARGIGAIIWDLSDAGFQYLPELSLPTDDPEKPEVVGITGLYNNGEELYLIEEGKSGVSVNEFYNPDDEVKPTVVTISPDRAKELFGKADNRKGFTLDGDLEEWLAVADCYYEAIAEE